MNELIVTLTIIITTLIGYIVIRFFNLLSRKDALLNISYSYGLGVGLISFQLYIYSRLNLSWNKFNIFIPWLFLLAYLLWKNKYRIYFSIPKLQKPTILTSLLILGILILISYTAIEALLRPNGTWDAFGIWLLRANIFFIDGKINPAMLNFIHVDYPLVISLYSTFVYLMLGNIDDRLVLLTSTAYYIFTALLLYSILRNRYSLRYSLLFTFLMVTTQNFVRHGGRFEAGQADLPLGYFFLICTNLLLNYIKNNSWKTFLLLNIFLGITGLIKFEGIPFVLVITICSLVYINIKKLYKHLIFYLFWIFPILDWQIYLKINHFSVTYFTVHKLDVSVKKTINAFTGTINELVNVKSWNLLWIIYTITLYLFGIKKNVELGIINFIILSQLAVYLLIYIITSANGPESSIERLLLHLAPLAFYYIAIVLEMVNIPKYIYNIFNKSKRLRFLLRN